MPLRRLRSAISRRLRAPATATVVRTTWQVAPSGSLGSWTDRTAVVAGAAGLLGRELVGALVANGAQVHALDINGAALEELSRLHRGRVQCHVVDLTDPRAVGAVVNTLAAQVSALDALIHCEGMNDYPTADEAIGSDQWNRILGINLVAPATLTDALVPLLGRVPGSGVVMVTSINGRATSIWLHYAAAKAGLTKLTKDLAARLAPRGIRVNAVAPGWFAPPNPDGTAPRSAGIALTQSALPVEAVANAVLFLAHPLLSPCTTGQELAVDGGTEIASNTVR